MNVQKQWVAERRHCILFVDDEPGMLKAFERLLHPERHRWEMIFASTTGAALEMLAERAIDVLVTEVRLTGQKAGEGVKLLDRVKRDHPSVTRIVFTAPGDRDTAVRLAGVAHQFLAKPFDVLGLRETLARACTVRELLERPALRDAVGGIGALPVVPALYLELQTALRDPRADLKAVASVVERDIGMSAKLLQLVNSAFFGVRNANGSSISSVEQAVMLLGMNTVQHLALASAVFSAYDVRDDFFGFSLSLMQRHALLTARIASRMMSTKQERDEAFVSGLLHDAGKLVLANRFPDAYRRIAAQAVRESLPLTLLESAEFGTSHPEVGAYLFGIWGLPTVVVEAVAFHHDPSAAGRSKFDVSGAVHVADVLAHEMTTPANDSTGRRAVLDGAYLDMTGLVAKLPAWRVMAAGLVGEN
jgi:HD-like signal output (HDOD) protein/ActR/RegA family two-component response regulator